MSFSVKEGRGAEMSFFSVKLKEFRLRKERLERIKADRPILRSKKIQLVGEINAFIRPLNGAGGVRRIEPFLSLIDEINGRGLAL